MNPVVSRFETAILALWLAATALCAGCASGGGEASEEWERVKLAVRLSRENPALGNAGSPGTPSKDGPKTAVMDGLVNLYQASVFNHRLHADMARMGEGCETCHHHSAGEDIPRCGRCHTAPLAEGVSGGLGLKGAYHHQCLGCHRSWGSRKDCGFCHLKKGETAPPEAAVRKPCASMPKMKEYRTTYEGGTRVAFDHENHKNECTGCADCHKGESCSACHLVGERKAVPPVKEKPKDPHGRCFPCHGKDMELEFDCEDCHTK